MVRAAGRIILGGAMIAMASLVIPASSPLAGGDAPDSSHSVAITSQKLLTPSPTTFASIEPREVTLDTTSHSATPSSPVEKAWQHLIQSPSLLHSQVSAYAVNLTTGQVIGSINPSVRLTPGSITKLFTSSAALATLGSQFTYDTSVQIPSSATAENPGPIFLVGNGDPWLDANGGTNLSTLAKKVAARVTRATAVIGVSSAFSGPPYGEGWSIGELSQNFAASTSALMAERSEVEVTISAATSVGQKPIVVLNFNGPIAIPQYFSIINNARMGSSSSSTTVSATRRLGTNQLVITGTLPLGSSPQSFVVSVGKAALFAASLFQSALATDGVHFTGNPSIADNTPSNARTIATLTSQPLQETLVTQNQYSINQMAENLYRTLGNGSLRKAVQVMNTFTKSADVSPNRVQVDGSGLSPLNQMSSQEVVQLLSYAHAESWGKTLRHSLIHLNDPTACGILCPPKWSYPLPTGAQIWVKTGNLANQWNLAGYVKNVNGDIIAFAILDDGMPTAANAYPQSAVDEMMTTLAASPVISSSSSSDADELPSGSLPASLESLLQKIPDITNGDDVGISLINAINGDPLFQQSGGTLIRSGLASRLWLDQAALQSLPSDLPPAKLLATGAIHRGILKGNLIINGNDNNLSYENLAAWATMLQRDGVRTVQGNLDYVNSVTVSGIHRWPQTMPWNDLGKPFAPPNSSLWLNGGLVQMKVHGGSSGTSATITSEPSTAPITFINHITVRYGSSTHLHAHLKIGTNTFVITGNISPNTTATLTESLPDPGRFCASVFDNDLKDVGITLSGTTNAITSAPLSAVLATAPPMAVTAVVNDTLSSPSILSSDLLLNALGPSAPPLNVGVLSEVNDLTGASLTNYLTANDLSSLLYSLYHSPKQKSLVQALSTNLWITTSPEQEEIVGFMAGPHHSEDAIAILVSGILWNHHFAPGVDS